LTAPFITVYLLACTDCFLNVRLHSLFPFSFQLRNKLLLSHQSGFRKYLIAALSCMFLTCFIQPVAAELRC